MRSFIGCPIKTVIYIKMSKRLLEERYRTGERILLLSMITTDANIDLYEWLIPLIKNVHVSGPIVSS